MHIASHLTNGKNMDPVRVIGGKNMKKRIIRALCMNTGPVLQGVGVITYLIAASADLEYSSFGAVCALVAVALIMALAGTYLEKVLPKYYRKYCRSQRQTSKVYRMEKQISKAA